MSDDAIANIYADAFYLSPNIIGVKYWHEFDGEKLVSKSRLITYEESHIHPDQLERRDKNK